MENQTYFVDVILPLALPRLLTYRVPRELNSNIRIGQRIIVQLGKTKLYTAIIKKIHDRAPSNYSAKYIESILDERPLINESQLEFWDWMAAYYCCTVGEVMGAALPSALKLSSETKFELNMLPDEFMDELNEKEKRLILALQNSGSLSLADITDVLQTQKVQSIVKSLIEKGIISSVEELKEKFKPKIIDIVELGPMADSEIKLKDVFTELEKRKSQKQIDALLIHLQISGWDEGKANEVPRLLLQQKANVTASVIAALAEKNIFSIRTKEIGRLPSHLLASEAPKTLSEAQNNACKAILESWKSKDITLLHGITSSGKTEVYAQLIQECLKRGEQVLFLLPEIALTTQIIHRLRKYFGKRVGVFHSGYSDNERTEVWNKVLTGTPGECDVILGARSALFLPFTRLNLIIVDEEHEQSFKQHDPAPRYHARDSAIWLAKQFNAKVLLGSATPAVETMWNAKQDRFGLVELTERFGGLETPEVVICDLRKEIKAKTMKSHFSSELLTEMQLAIEKGEQIILFQNRRGYTPIWECHSCGWIPNCTRCDVSLTYHKKIHQLKCHYCGYSIQPVQACQACGSVEMKMLGFGTEKIEEDLETFLPGVKVQRMDLDTTRNKSGYQKIISDFESGHVQVLVGTQMVTKGLDFDNVSLVGILSADKMLNYPDFRSIERGFQLMMQVAGRAGRKNKRGRVLIQTYNPDHWLLDMIAKNDYAGFYDKEIIDRYHFSYPPFIRLMRITVKHKSDDVADSAAIALQKKLLPELREKVLGPETPLVPRINTYYLRQLLVKLDRTKESALIKARIQAHARELLAEPGFKSARISIDVDPL
jgi:primosomal protein N' (replication factor Y) (superfamily II helicase)